MTQEQITILHEYEARLNYWEKFIETAMLYQNICVEDNGTPCRVVHRLNAAKFDTSDFMGNILNLAREKAKYWKQKIEEL